MDAQALKKTANEVRKGIVTACFYAKAGHPGGALSSAEIYTYLYMVEMNVNPARPDDPDRDRFVLSKGHSCPGLYAVMAEKGYFDKEELKTFRHLGSRLQGHPCMRYLPGLDMSTGSLGQGVSTAVGMALSARIQHRDYRTYTLLGDGELEEGQVWEAAMFAGAKKLDNLCLIIDNNNLQIDGSLEEVNSPYPIGEKFAAFGFHVIHADGHDFEALAAAFKEAKETKGKPSVIVCKTLKGKGVSFMENVVSWHGKAPDEEQYKIAMADLERIGETL
ncbi:MAG: transketolase [Lachnospiraceae bacterium]|nr:transketolase [Lachnospiraceae bacterium]